MQISKLVQFGLLCATMACGTVEVLDDNNGDGDGGSGGNPAVAPSIASITPENGPLAGGNEITLKGENLSDSLTVVMNGQEIADVSSPDENTLVFSAADGDAAGQVVDVFVYGDTGFGLLQQAYVYNAVPTVEAFAPNFSGLAGGDEVTIHGTGFELNNPTTPTVLFGDQEASNVEVVDDSTIIATVPGASSGLVAMPLEVKVETDNGDVVAEDPFTYVRPGLLLGTRVEGSEVPLGIHFYDLPTGRIAHLTALEIGIGRMELVPGEGLILRGNRVGGGSSGRSTLFKVDLVDGTLDVLGGIFTGQSLQTIRPIAFVAGQFFGLRFNGRLGTIDLNNENQFAELSTVNGNGRGCLSAFGAGSLLHMDQSTGLISTVSTAGVFTAGPDLSGLPQGSFGCHGSTQIGNEIFAIFLDRSQSSGEIPLSGVLARINPTTGSATILENLPGGFGAIAPTPAGF